MSQHYLTIQSGAHLDLCRAIRSESPASKSLTKYLHLLYRGLRYPRLARFSRLENGLLLTSIVIDTQASYAEEGSGSGSQRATYCPPFCSYLISIRGQGENMLFDYEISRTVAPLWVFDAAPFRFPTPNTDMHTSSLN